MKIVINAFSARYGGGQTYLQNLLINSDSFTDSSIIILAPNSLKLPDHPAISRWVVNWPTDNPLLRTLWEIFVLPSILKKTGADVLFCPGGLVNTNVSPKCCTVTMSQNMIPFTPSIRQLYPLGWQRIRNWLLERAMLKSLTKADLVIFLSEHAQRVIQSYAGQPFNNSVTIPHGLSDHFRVDFLDEPIRPKGLPNEYLLYVSIFEPYKHHLEVVQGFHQLKSVRPTQEKLILAGNNDVLFGKVVKEEIIRLGLQDDVMLVGNIANQDLPAYYRHAKINIFASECENCPNILLEAMGAGRPLLVSNFPPMPEFGGDAVRYFDPSSPEDFVRQILSIIDDPEELTRLGSTAREQSKKYDWRETARRTWEAIRKVVEDRSHK